MMKIYIQIFILFFVLSAARAQNDSTFTLQQCLDYALANQLSIKNAEADYESSKAKVGEIRAVGLPQITGAASVVDNPNLRRMFFTASHLNPFTSSLGMPEGSVVAFPNLFQLRSSGDASVTLSQLIFNGSYIVGLQTASGYKELARRGITQSKIQTVEAVTKAFYQVLINQARIELLNANLSRLDSTLRQTKALQTTGYAEQIDVDRLEVAYNNLLTDKQKFDNGLALFNVLLKFQMGMPLEQPLVLKGNISDAKLDAESTVSHKAEYSDRIEYSLLQSQRKLQVMDRKNIYAGYLPSLAAFATGGYTRQDKHVRYLFNGSAWYKYSMIGLNLNVPIFDGFSKHYRSQQARLNIVKTDNNLINLQRSIDLQVQQSEIILKNSLQTLANQKRNLDLAQEVVRVTKVKYQAGVGSNIEVINAEASLREAQTNYYNALYDALVAKVDLDKALGTLYKE